VLAFSVVAIIIVIGFLGNLLFRKTGFPDILFLLSFGLLLGPVLQIFPRQNLLPIAPYLTLLALIMVLFNGGIEMNLYKVLSQSVRASILATLYFILCTLGVALFASFIFNMGWIESLMLGPMIAGTSSVVIIPLASKLNLDEQTAMTLSLESAITDVLNIVFLFALLQAYLAAFPGIQETVSSIAAKFSVGSVLGFIVGIAWLRALYIFRREEYTYMLTIAVLICCYVVSELLGGSGVLSSLVFGLVLGNDEDIIKMLRMDIDSAVLNSMKEFLKRFQSELSFLIKAFFFVFLGLIYEVSGLPLALALIYGIALTALDLGLRYAAVHVSTIKSPMASNRVPMTLMCGQGLAHAALSVIPMQYGLPKAHIYVTIVVTVILLTNIVTSISALMIQRRSKPSENPGMV
jgi:cell volume regulation protein A